MRLHLPGFDSFFHHSGLQKDDLAVGRIEDFPFSWTFRLRPEERATHCYVLGITGQGKSKLLEQMLFQDISAGRGCGLVDPHSDLAQDLLAYLAETKFFDDPQNRARIVYFDPSREDYFVPFNVLSGSDSPYVTASNVVEAFRRTWPEALHEAPRFTNIMLASLLILMANRLTLVQLPLLLTDKDFRETLLMRVEDPDVVSVFHDRVDKWGRDRALFLEAVMNKVSAFTLNPTLRLILGQQENRLDFREIMDEGRVLIADLGRCDGETRRLLGSLIVTGMEQAALSRKDQPPEARRSFYMYIDEFQDFVANEGSALTLSHILSEARKFGLHLTLAHQVLMQMTSERIQAALGNIGTKIVFAVDRGDAEIMAKKLYQVTSEEVKHEVSSSEQQGRMHPLYYSLPEEWEEAIQELQNLKPRTAVVKAPQRPVAKIQTVSVPPHRLSGEDLEKTRVQLLQQIGKPVAPPNQDGGHGNAPLTPAAELADEERVARPEPPPAPSTNSPANSSESDAQHPNG